MTYGSGGEDGDRRRRQSFRTDGGEPHDDELAAPADAADDVATAVLHGVGTPVVVCEFVDDEAVIHTVNDAFATAFDCTPVAARDEPLEQFLDGTDDLPELDRRTRVAREPVRRRTADGWREFRLGVVPIETDASEPDRQVAIYSDAGVRQEYDRKLEALHRSTRNLIQQETKAGIAKTAVDAAVEILGLPATSVHLVDDEREILPPTATSDRVQDIIGEPPSLPIDDSLAGTAYRTGDPIVYEDPSQHPGVYNPDTPLESEVILPLGTHGALLCAATEPSAFSDADVSLATILASNTEAALDRVEREETLARRERELARQNERLDAFASMVSHDLRNPLNVARGSLDLAREDGDLDKLDDVEYSLGRMESLIGDLLELARQGEALGEVEAVDLASVATDAWAQVATVEATLTVEDGLGSVEADPGRLATVFENLYRNAVEHGSDGVHVVVGPTDDGFFVEDDGPGIPPERRDAVFEVGHSSTAEGTGIGLAIVEEVVEAHGWRVSATEGREGGARFEVSVGPAPTEAGTSTGE